MKKTSSIIVKLPEIKKDEEIDAKSYDYARRTVQPLLKQVIINPFETALKERLFDEAIQAEGKNSEGIIKKGHTSRIELDNKNFQLEVQPSTRVSMEKVLSNIKVFLNTAIKDKIAGKKRTGVEKKTDDIYIELQYLMGAMNDFKTEHTTAINKKDLSILDATGKKIENDKYISLMRIYYNSSYSSLNHKNAEEFLKAKSLKSRIDAFERKFKKSLIEKFAAEEIEEKQDFDYELSDGAGVRYLFYPETITQYGKVYDALLKQKTEKVTSTSGDLNALEQLLFADYYEYPEKNPTISVTLNKSKEATIEKTNKKGDWKKSRYGIILENSKIYVKIEDILERIEDFTILNTKTTTKTKIDFFASPPDYLRD